MDLAKEVSREQVEAWSGGKWADRARLCRGRRRGRAAPRRRGRLWLQAQHLPQSGRGRGAGDGRAGDRQLRRDHGARARRLLPVERAGRSGGDGGICGAGDPADAGDRRSRCSASASATSCSRSRSAGRRRKMFQGHRGANHPVKRLADGAVEITSMNHGFAVEREGLPDNVRETHVSLFDGQQLRDRADRPPGVQRPIPPRGEPGAAGQLLSVREVRGDDASEVRRSSLISCCAVRVRNSAERPDACSGIEWHTTTSLVGSRTSCKQPASRNPAIATSPKSQIRR